jgi:hypothetical protein
MVALMEPDLIQLFDGSARRVCDQAQPNPTQHWTQISRNTRRPTMRFSDEVLDVVKIFLTLALSFSPFRVPVRDLNEGAISND